MGLKVIGAGFGRTGTTSLQKALEILGVGPCYHLNEIINGPDEQVQVINMSHERTYLVHD